MSKEQLLRKNPEYAKDIETATDEEIRLATDPEYAKQNMDRFLTSRFDPTRESTAEDFIMGIKSKLAPAANSALNTFEKGRDKAFGTTYGNALGYGAGAGALGGLALSLLRDGESPIQDALLGVGIGAGLGFYSRRSRENIAKNLQGLQKQSSFSDLNFIQQKIMSEPSMSGMEKQRAIQRISSLPESQISQLSRMLKTAFGASVGMIISQFLGGGLLGGIGGALLGGFLGFRSHDPFIVDAFGRKKLLNFP